MRKAKSKLEVQQVIVQHKAALGFFGRLGGVHPAIQAAENILKSVAEPNLTQEAKFALAKCFVLDHPIEKGSKLFEVFKSIVDCFPNTLMAMGSSNIFTEANFNTVNVFHQAKPYSSDGVDFSLSTLGDQKLLSQKNFNTFFQHENPDQQSGGFYLLEMKPLLNQERFELIMAHQDPFHLSNLFHCMSMEDAMQRNNLPAMAQTLDAILKCQNLYWLIKLVRMTLGKLTLERLNWMLDPVRVVLFSDAAQDRVWSRIPDHLSTAGNLGHLVMLAGTPPAENALNNMEAYLNLLLNNNNAHNPAFPAINASQSTHTVSVHKTVSESATRLNKRYGDKLNRDGQKNTINELTQWVTELPKGPLVEVISKNATAKRCLLGDNGKEGILKSTFVDPGSSVSTQKLLALTWLAIHDDPVRLSTFEDACEQWIQGLYEIRRGYNLSETDQDDGQNDRPICQGGAFNKMLEKLQSIHPDIEIIYLTKATASIKLQSVVRAEVRAYLSTLSETNFAETLKKLEVDGVEAIWPEIQVEVSAKVFKEFGSLFKNEEKGPTFLAFIDTGKYTELGDLNNFKPSNNLRLSQNAMILLPSPRDEQDKYPDEESKNNNNNNNNNNI